MEMFRSRVNYQRLHIELETSVWEIHTRVRFHAQGGFFYKSVLPLFIFAPVEVSGLKFGTQPEFGNSMLKPLKHMNVDLLTNALYSCEI